MFVAIYVPDIMYLTNRHLKIRDRQVAISAGAPMIINDMDCDIELLSPEDFADESVDTVQYLIAQIDLNRAGTRELHFPERDLTNQHSISIILRSLLALNATSKQRCHRPLVCKA